MAVGSQGFLHFLRSVLINALSSNVNQLCLQDSLHHPLLSPFFSVLASLRRAVCRL